MFNDSHPGTTHGDSFDFFATTTNAKGTNSLTKCIFKAKEDDALKSSGGFSSDGVIRESPKFASGKAAYSFAPPYMLSPSSSGHKIGGIVLDWMATATDIAGNARLSDGKVDMGCYQCTLQPLGIILVVR